MSFTDIEKSNYKFKKELLLPPINHGTSSTLSTAKNHGPLYTELSIIASQDSYTNPNSQNKVKQHFQSVFKN